MQVFNASRAYVRTIGETGVSGRRLRPSQRPERPDRGRRRPHCMSQIAWNNRVQVFDKDGAYLTTVDGSHGHADRRQSGAAAWRGGRAGLGATCTSCGTGTTPVSRSSLPACRGGCRGTSTASARGQAGRLDRRLSCCPSRDISTRPWVPQCLRVWRMTPDGVGNRANADGLRRSKATTETDALAEFQWPALRRHLHLGLR